jgi:hypothetical protein
MRPGAVQQRPAPGRHERADDVIDVGGRTGGRTHLGRRPEATAVRVRQVQDQVGERQVGDDLPVGDQQVQPVEVGRPKRRVLTDHVVERGHGSSLGVQPG